MEGRRRQSGNADVREPENENSENEWGVVRRGDTRDRGGKEMQML